MARIKQTGQKKMTITKTL